MGNLGRMTYVVDNEWYDIDIEELDEMNQWLYAKKMGLNRKPPKSMVKIDPPYSEA